MYWKYSANYPACLEKIGKLHWFQFYLWSKFWNNFVLFKLSKVNTKTSKFCLIEEETKEHNSVLRSIIPVKFVQFIEDKRSISYYTHSFLFFSFSLGFSLSLIPSYIAPSFKIKCFCVLGSIQQCIWSYDVYSNKSMSFNILWNNICIK